MTEFPRIPFTGWAVACPGWLDWGALAGVVAGCLLLVVPRGGSRFGVAGRWLLVLALPASIVLDQHRLQPWAYELWLLVTILSIARPRIALRLLRVFVASVYVHSALSKLDASFFDSHGQLLLNGLIDALGLTPAFLSESLRIGAIGLFPVGELAIGVGLLIPRTRMWALGGSVVMHALLLVILGPLGLDHKPGVLFWNVCFIAQNLVLYGWRSSASPPEEEEAAERTGWGRGDLAAASLALFAVGAPSLQPVGWFDNWPAWAVYSARPAIVEVLIHETRVSDLPGTLQPHVGPPRPLQNWRPVSLDAWSFSELDCPVYPQERYRLAVALALADRAGLGNDVRVVVDGSPDRWSGVRETTVMNGHDEIAERCRRFRVNTRCRDFALSHGRRRRAGGPDHPPPG